MSIVFAPVNVVGALLWGYGVRHFGMARTTSRYFMLNVLVAFACSLVAAPIILALGRDGPDNAVNIATIILGTSNSLVVAVFSANLLTSIIDKLISGFAALAAADALGVDVRTFPSPGRRGRRQGGLMRRWTDLTGSTLAEER